MEFVADKKVLTTDEPERIARGSDVNQRMLLARRPKLDLYVMGILAKDSEEKVRMELAQYCRHKGLLRYLQKCDPSMKVRQSVELNPLLKG